MVTLQFSTQDALISLLIRLGTWSPYSHVDIVLPNGTLLGSRHDVVGSIPAGVQIRPANYATFSKVAVYNIGCDAATTQQFYKVAKKQIGKPYNLAAIVGNFVGRNWHAGTQNGFFCSELVAYCFEQVGFALLNPTAVSGYSRITPQELILSPYMELAS